MACSWKFLFVAVVVPKVKAGVGSSLDDEVEAVRSDVHPTSQELEHLKSKIQSSEATVAPDNVRTKLMGKTFNIQMKRSFAKNQDTIPGKLFILSLRNNERVSDPPLSTTGMDSTESSKRKLHQIAVKEGNHQATSNKDNISYQQHSMGLKSLKKD